jgi:hypothetical protein
MTLSNTLSASSVQLPATTKTPHHGGQETAQQPLAHMLILTSSMSMSREIAQQQERAITLLRAKGIEFETLDGALAVNKTRRNELFALSGLRAKYPQFFLVHDEDNGRDKRLSFFADWETLEAINDASKMPEHILDANPSIITWDRALGFLTAPTMEDCRVPERGTGLETHKHQLPKSNIHSINNSTW